MRYKVFVSNGAGDSEVFYCDRKDQADLLFNMAKDSKMFSYVELNETVDEDFLIREWGEDDG